MLQARLMNQLADQGFTQTMDLNHALRVMHLGLRLYDQLQSLHGLGRAERRWLAVAALIHDMAKPRSPRQHHKLARDWVIQAKGLPFHRDERVIIGLVARYHRGCEPEPHHRFYADLDICDKVVVCKLAALLRLADGLDRSRGARVGRLSCHIRKQSVRLKVVCQRGFTWDKFKRKAGLFERVFSRRVHVQYCVAPKESVLQLEDSSAITYAEAS